MLGNQTQKQKQRQKQKQQSLYSVIRRVATVVGCVLYELQPVEPTYAWHTVKDATRHARQLWTDAMYPLLAKSLALLYASPGMCIRAARRHPNKAALCVLWCLLWYAAATVEFGSVFVMCSAIAAMFFNLGDRRHGDFSAYSVFNAGFAAIAGSTTAEDIDAQIRRGGQ